MFLRALSRRLRLAAVLVFVCAAVVTAIVVSRSANASDDADPKAEAGAKNDPHTAAKSRTGVTFEDNFDGPAGAPVDGAKWVTETGDNVDNHERQYYTTSTSNASLDGQGNLVITARRENPANYRCWYGACEYTSARLNTSGKFDQTYGHYEARIKMSRGQGMWPAFWALGDNIGDAGWPRCGEIDIMENVGAEPSQVHGTMHGPGYSGGDGIGAGYSIGGAFADDFHVFAVDWSPNKIVWSVDGNVYQTRTPADLNGRQWVFDHPFFLILNLAVGGDWPGDPDANTPFPNTLVVDYVRVNDTPEH